MIPSRDTPTPRARRIWEDIASLTLHDLVWLRRCLLDEMGDPPEGVREPRRPIEPHLDTSIALQAASGFTLSVNGVTHIPHATENTRSLYL